MTISYEIDRSNRLVRIVTQGITTKIEWHDVYVRLKRDTDREEDYNVLLDFHNHESVVPVAVADALSKKIEQKVQQVKWAFVVSRVLSEERVCFIYHTLKEKNIDVRIFRQIPEAEEWLLQSIE